MLISVYATIYYTSNYFCSSKASYIIISYYYTTSRSIILPYYFEYIKRSKMNIIYMLKKQFPRRRKIKKDKWVSDDNMLCLDEPHSPGF